MWPKFFLNHALKLFGYTQKTGKDHWWVLYLALLRTYNEDSYFEQAVSDMGLLRKK